jgi:hypothetical protein
MVTRAFTIYQLAELIIYRLPRIIQQFEEAKSGDGGGSGDIFRKVDLI